MFLKALKNGELGVGGREEKERKTEKGQLPIYGLSGHIRKFGVLSDV